MTAPTRLSIYINNECTEFIRQYMHTHQISATETIRRAVGVFKICEFYTDAGGELLVKQPNGDLLKLELLYKNAN